MYQVALIFHKNTEILEKEHTEVLADIVDGKSSQDELDIWYQN